MTGHHGSLGTAPPGLWESQPRGSKEQRQPPGSLADLYHRHEMETDNKRNITLCRQPWADRTALPGHLLARSIWAPSRGTSKGTRPQKAERKEPRSWHSFTFYPSIHPLASNTCWCNFPPLIRRSAAGADLTALPQGNSGRVSIPTFSPGQEMPLLPDHLLHPRTAYFSSRRPFYYKGPLIQGVLREKATLPGYTRASLPTLTNTCLTSGFSPHPSVT